MWISDYNNAATAGNKTWACVGGVRFVSETGSTVDEITAYSTESPGDTGELAKKAYEEGVDFTTFTSSSTVKNLVDLMGGNPDLINTSKTVIIGPITSETARELGVNVDLQAKEQSTDGIVKAITKYLQ